ncbi:hypothetical protein BS78_05G106900 [Paspalum vaginatum]|nr:hypothetical protein BS78_05G106900 [Paspalum vaginatum]
MAQELAVSGVVGAHRPPSTATGGKGGLQERCDRFAVRREVLAVGEMSVLERRILMKRLESELDAVRHLLAKVELFPSGVVGAGAVCAAAPTGGGRLVAAEAVAEDGGGGAAKKRKLTSWEDSIPPKRVTPDDRNRLARRLAALAARLPDHGVAFLQEDQRGVIGDGADPHGDGGEVEMDLDTNVQSVKDDGSLVVLKKLLDRFVPLRSTSTPPKCHGHGRTPLVAASSVSCQSQHEEAGDKMAPMQEEEEEEEGVDICGGVSHMTIRDIADELVADIGVLRLLSPLPLKYVDIAEQGGEYYVDICGDASPVVLLPAKPGDGNSSLGLSSSGSDASPTDSDSSSGDSDMGPNEPAPEALQVAEPVAEVQANGTPTTPAVILISSKPHVPAVVVPKENDICARAPPERAAPKMGPNEPPPEPAPEALQIAEAVAEVQAMSTPTTPAMILINSSPHVPAVLPKENGICAPAAPETVQLMPSPTPLADLIAMAQEAAEQRRQEEKEPVKGMVQVEEEEKAKEECARVKARRELLEMERAALPDERIHPLDMELLGIAAFQHVVSTVRPARTRTAQPQVDVSVTPRISPGHPSILQQLGVFLKADDGGEEEEEQQQQQQPPPPLGFVAFDGEHVEIEDGEIL